MKDKILAGFRYRVIDKCLRRKYQQYTYKKLVEAISDELLEHYDIKKVISRRTFFIDLDTMRSPAPRGYDAPIVVKNGVYSYSDPNFSILNSPFTANDLNDLKEAISILSQFRGLPNFVNIDAMIGKLKAEMVSYNMDTSSYLLLDSNESYTGYHWIEPLYNAIKDEVCLKVKYKPFTEEKPLEFTFHPYLIKEYNNRWFVLGWHQKEKQIYNLAMDRIQQLKPSKEIYLTNGKSELNNYFNNIIGVSLPRNAKIEKITLQIASNLYPYFETKPLHKSQKVVKETKKFVTIELQLIVNLELVSTLMKFIDRIKIIGPISLRNTIKKALADGMALNQ
jgi:predicted DNA-binding transcriptional regulator YafY